MRLFIYWDHKDHDCEKIFHFMSDRDEDTIIKILNTHAEVSIKRYTGEPFDKERVFQNIAANDVIIFMTHGDEENILKCRNKEDRPFEDYILIGRKNVSILKDKIILAFCCHSASSLGETCSQGSNCCKAYVGFKDEIVYDDGKLKKSRHIIYTSYKRAFKKSLVYAAKSKCNVSVFKKYLSHLLNKEAARAILNSENNSISNLFATTNEGLVALGNVEANIF